MDAFASLVAARLRSTLDPERVPQLFGQQLTIVAGHDRVVVRWVGGPRETDVRTLMQQPVTARDVPVVLERTPLWDCGRAHANAGEAFLAHEGAGLLTVTRCDDCDSCSDVTAYADVQLLGDHLAAGLPTSRAASPARTVAATRAATAGTTADPITLRMRTCLVCHGDRVPPLDDLHPAAAGS